MIMAELHGDALTLTNQARERVLVIVLIIISHGKEKGDTFLCF